MDWNEWFDSYKDRPFGIHEKDCRNCKKRKYCTDKTKYAGIKNTCLYWERNKT